MAENSILPAVWEVPQIFRDRLGLQAGRQRTMFHEGHLLLVLHEPPKPGDTTRRGRFFWRQPDGTWSSNGLGSGPNAITKHLNEYAELLERYTKLEEDASGADAYFSVLESIAPLHRAAMNMQQVLQEARKLVAEDRNIINFRDQAYEIERTAELLYNVAKNSLDFEVARRAEDQARAAHSMAVSAHRLNLLVAFFFPIATLTAVFGMNLESGLADIQRPLPFLIVIFVGLWCGFVLTRFVTNKSKQDQ